MQIETKLFLDIVLQTVMFKKRVSDPAQLFIYSDRS